MLKREGERRAFSRIRSWCSDRARNGQITSLRRGAWPLSRIRKNMRDTEIGILWGGALPPSNTIGISACFTTTTFPPRREGGRYGPLRLGKPLISACSTTTTLLPRREGARCGPSLYVRIQVPQTLCVLDIRAPSPAYLWCVFGEGGGELWVRGVWRCKFVSNGSVFILLRSNAHMRSI